MSSPKRIEDLVDEFAICVIAQDEALRRSNSHVGNKFARRQIQIFRTLRSTGDSGREALARLLLDSNKCVRVMTAAFLLRYKNLECLEVLRAEAKGKGLVAFGASECLKRWYEGSWSLDPAD